MSNPIVSRKYYALKVELVSPLSISNGQNYYTDSDIMRNSKGEVFIPGTSLAGAFRSYLGDDKKQESIYGFSENEKGRMSSLYISDLYFDTRPDHAAVRVSVRDGVALTEEKQADNKFDMEIIESGACGIIYFHYIVRQNRYSNDQYEEAVDSLIQAIQDGTVRIGANKNRGFGRLKVNAVCVREFTAADVEENIAFKRSCNKIELYEEMPYETWVKGRRKPEEKYLRISVPLKLKGGISIRRYSTKPGQADFEHITCNRKPVIPGSSWNGAIRSSIREILKSLGHAEPEKIVEKWFGKAEIGKKDVSAVQSMIVFGESVIEGAEALPMTRNKVGRFDASALALYSEIAYFGGHTVLEIMVRKDSDRDYLALLGILLFVIEDMQKGYLAVGGQTAIGRGIFEKDPEKEVEYSEAVSREECLAELCSL